MASDSMEPGKLQSVKFRDPEHLFNGRELDMLLTLKPFTS